MKIGVFDSGLGGITILKELLNKLPQYSYIYLGDNARVPYGNRSPEIIYEFTREAVDFLFKKGCQLIIIACNTSTTTSLRKIQHEYLPKYYPDRRVLGVVKPVVEEMAEKKYPKIGVIGTKATVNSEAFVREINKILPKSKVFQQACPLLVPFIEDGAKSKKILDLILKEYLGDLKQKNINALILACTHYELLKKEIQDVVGEDVKVLSEGKIVAKKLIEYLKNHPETEKKLEKRSGREFYVTDLNPDYERLIELFLGHHFNEGELKLVSL